MAVIFGGVALSRISKSVGRLTGRGLAIAGLVIGSVGILGSALLFAVVGIAVHEVTSTTHLSLGQAARPPAPDANGIASLNVKQFTEPVTPNNPLVAPTQGMVFAVIDVRVCAGSSGSSAPWLVALSLVLPDKATVDPSSSSAMSPSLLDNQPLSPNACSEGYLTFQVPSGTRPVDVRWTTNVIGPTFEWHVP